MDSCLLIQWFLGVSLESEVELCSCSVRMAHGFSSLCIFSALVWVFQKSGLRFQGRLSAIKDRHWLPGWGFHQREFRLGAQTPTPHEYIGSCALGDFRSKNPTKGHTLKWDDLPTLWEEAEGPSQGIGPETILDPSVWSMPNLHSITLCGDGQDYVRMKDLGQLSEKQIELWALARDRSHKKTTITGHNLGRRVSSGQGDEILIFSKDIHWAFFILHSLHIITFGL